VLDLRSKGETPHVTCRFANQEGITWENVPLFDYDLSAPSMPPVRATDNYLVTGYLHMLSSHDAIRRVFSFFAQADKDECVLFHCAAGIDRTGVVAMLLLGLADVTREQVIADYGYSFGSVAEVNALVSRRKDCPPARVATMLQVRLDTIANVYDTVVHEHGSVRAYLESCGVESETIASVRAHLLEP
jgi:protein-tyrosine phosphatase